MLSKRLSYACADAINVFNSDFWRSRYGKTMNFGSEGWLPFVSERRTGNELVIKPKDARYINTNVRVKVRTNELIPISQRLVSEGIFVSDSALEGLALMKRGIVK